MIKTCELCGKPTPKENLLDVNRTVDPCRFVGGREPCNRLCFEKPTTSTRSPSLGYPFTGDGLNFAHRKDVTLWLV